MKKIALLLAVIMVVAVFAVACADEAAQPADAEAPAETAEPAEAAEPAATDAEPAEADASGETFKIGVLPFWTSCPWFDPFTAGGVWYLQSKGCETVVENAEWDTTKYIAICETWANDPDIDAVIAAPLAGEEVRRGLDEIVKAGKPLVITNNECGKFDEVLFSVSYDAMAGCPYMAQRAVDAIKETRGEVKGTVILDLGSLTNPEHVQRAEAIKGVLAEYPDLKVKEFESEMMVDTAVTRCSDLLRTNEDTVAVIAIGQSSFIGCINAINAEGLAKPIGDPDHIVCCGMDTSAEIINENIKSGVVDFAVDQPVMAYNAIAGYYLYKYLTEGESALPQAGTKIEATDIDINVPIPDYATDAEQLKGMTIPGDAWAPAEVIDKTEEYGHNWIKTSYTVVDQSNIDDPTLFSNISGLIKDWGF